MKVRKGTRVKFWEHVLCGNERLMDVHHSILQWADYLKMDGGRCRVQD